MIMRFLSSLRIAVPAAIAALLSVGAEAGPMPTHVAAMKSMVDQSTSEVRWVGGWRGGGYGYRGVGFRGGGWAIAVDMAIAASATAPPPVQSSEARSPAAAITAATVAV